MRWPDRARPSCLLATRIYGAVTNGAIEKTAGKQACMTSKPRAWKRFALYQISSFSDRPKSKAPPCRRNALGRRLHRRAKRYLASGLFSGGWRVSLNANRSLVDGLFHHSSDSVSTLSPSSCCPRPNARRPEPSLWTSSPLLLKYSATSSAKSSSASSCSGS